MISYDEGTAAELGRQITEARLAQGRSKQEVAFAAKMPVERLRRLEAGGRVDILDFANVASFLRIWLVIGLDATVTPRPGCPPRLGSALAPSWLPSTTS